LFRIAVFNNQSGVRSDPYDGGGAQDIPFGNRYPLTCGPKPMRLPGDAFDGVKVRPPRKTRAKESICHAEKQCLPHADSPPEKLVRYFHNGAISTFTCPV
jgi:hypothetical protein